MVLSAVIASFAVGTVRIVVKHGRVVVVVEAPYTSKTRYIDGESSII